MTEIREHWTSRQVDYVANQIWGASLHSSHAVITTAVYNVAERLGDYPVRFKGLGWEHGVCMLLADLVEQEILPWYRKSYSVAPTRDTAERIVERLIELCKENPRGKV